MGHEVKPSVMDLNNPNTGQEPLKTYNKRKEVDVVPSQEAETYEQTDVPAPRRSRYPAGKLFFGDDIDATSQKVKESAHKQRRTQREPVEVSPRDIVNDLVKSSHRIWEEAAIGVIYENYHPDVTVHQGVLQSHGVSDVVTKTMQMLHAFSNFRVIGEGVTSAKNQDGSLYVSQRTMANGVNSSDSIFGPVTGQRVSFRSISDQVVYRQRVVEEWQIRDNLHIVKQLGLDPFEIAGMLANIASKQPGNCHSSATSNNRQGQLLYTNDTNSAFDVGDFIFEFFSRVWNYHYFNEMDDFYLSHATSHTVCNKDLSGVQQMQSFLMSFFASVPNARVAIERVTCENLGDHYDWNAAVRWRIAGLHEGLGFFGPPTGQPVEISGISHLNIQDGKIAEEWLLFDGMDVLRQLYMPMESSFTQI